MSNPNPDALLDAEPIGQLQSMTIKSAIVGILAILSAVGVKWVVSDEQIAQITTGILTLVSLGSMVMAWIGRVRARQIVRPGATGKKIAGLLILAAIAVTGTGCQNLWARPTTQPATVQTQLGRLYEFKRIYTVALKGLAGAMQAGAFTKDQIKLVMAISGEIDSGIEAAEKAISAGDKSGAEYWLERITSALNRYLELKATAAPTPRPATRQVGEALPTFEVQRWKYWRLSQSRSSWPMTCCRSSFTSKPVTS